MKRDKKVAELTRDCRELRNCGSQILKFRNRSSATFFSPQFRNRFGCPQYCGIAEVRTKIADAHLCLFHTVNDDVIRCTFPFVQTNHSHCNYSDSAQKLIDTGPRPRVFIFFRNSRVFPRMRNPR
jgi:hypothetical protein